MVLIWSLLGAWGSYPKAISRNLHWASIFQNQIFHNPYFKCMKMI